LRSNIRALLNVSDPKCWAMIEQATG